MESLSVPAILFGVVILLGIYKLLIEPLIGGGKHHGSSHSDRRHHR